jgi:S1-C subfamily serine protease
MAVQVSHLGQIVDRIGFAVPVDTLKSVLPRLKEGKEDTVVRPAWIGIQAMDLTSQLAEELDLPVQKGVYVTRVIGGGPAEEAGLTGAGVDSEGELASGGDIITAVDGVEVEAVTDVIAYLNSKQPGDVVTLTVIRDGETIEISVTLGEWPEALPRE